MLLHNTVVEIAIVGTGPTAWASYIAISKRDKNDFITFIDVGNRLSEELHSTIVSGQKTKFNSTYMYVNSPNPKDNNFILNESAANGGLSATWGAGIRVWPLNVLQKMEMDVDSIYEAAIELLKEMPYTGGHLELGIPQKYGLRFKNQPLGCVPIVSNQSSANSLIEVLTPSLAVQTGGMSKCTGCGTCLTGCPVGSIFDSGDYIDRLVGLGKVKRVLGRVVRVSENNRVEIELEGKEQKLIFDEVVLCAGAIGTPRILLQSGYIPEFCVKDSQVFYFVGIRLRKNFKSEFRFSLSKNSLYSSSNSPVRFYASLYNCNPQVRDRISVQFSKFLFGLKLPLPKFIDRFLILGIGFLHSDDSATFHGSESKNGGTNLTMIHNYQSRTKIKQSLKIISESLRSDRILIPTLLRIIPAPGSGFHSGGSTPVDSKYINNQGQLRVARKISVGDTSLLPFIEAGPHTFMAMCVAFNNELKRGVE